MTVVTDKEYFLSKMTLIYMQRIFFVLNVEAGAASSDSKAKLTKSKYMRDFVGVDKHDTDTILALLSFSYFLTVGDMDKAYRSVRSISNPVVKDIVY
jgi:hypothetical protein